VFCVSQLHNDEETRIDHAEADPNRTGPTCKCIDFFKRPETARRDTVVRSRKDRLVSIIVPVYMYDTTLHKGKAVMISSSHVTLG
jgi:hypothetical protein